jgi:hypothetical protein
MGSCDFGVITVVVQHCVSGHLADDNGRVRQPGHMLRYALRLCTIIENT